MAMKKLPKLPKLPKLLNNKIYKTGLTRGADDNVIYQNRVLRNNTVLIPYEYIENCLYEKKNEIEFENGYIVLISPEKYFKSTPSGLEKENLFIGKNCLIFYQTREEWNEYKPYEKGLKPATSRISPLGGQFIARVPATTAVNGGSQINEGFNTTKNKGAGIRVYEYASNETINKCRLQLESLFWLCDDSIETVKKYGMSSIDAESRKKIILNKASEADLLDYSQMKKARVLDSDNKTICPLCLTELSSEGFFSRVLQAEGREVHNLTATQINLFHIEELRIGMYNHKPYNLGWGHHHCNIVVKDSGVEETLNWMKEVIERHKDHTM